MAVCIQSLLLSERKRHDYIQAIARVVTAYNYVNDDSDDDNDDADDSDDDDDINTSCNILSPASMYCI